MDETLTKIKAVKDEYIQNCKSIELLEMEFSGPNKLNNSTDEVNNFKEDALNQMSTLPNAMRQYNAYK